MAYRGYSRAQPGLTWFELGLGLFATSLPIGLVVLLVAPFSFFHVLGTTIVGMALIGIWVSALGLKLEHPDRWNALKLAFHRATAPASPSRVVEP